jgi:hypothetical protein
MRSISRLTAGLALVTMVPAVAAAQSERPFADSWFWGVKGGAMTVKTNTDSKIAPTVGAEWLITRTRAGLYISLEQGFFDDMAASVADTSVTGGARPVAIRNFRRAAFSLMAFPKQWGSVRPYAGLGLSLNLVQRAQPVGTFATNEGKDEVMQRVEDRRSRTSVLFMGGVQGDVGPVALFAQATAMPTGSRFLLSGDDNTYMLEAGVRINMGSAIERIDR